ncbi:hypothetical protein [Glutamicibacter sp. 2E12]|uniref:hypothetical protein n=1 Tax=Glutamicibacter sp. 2E12 TaxID=3416181 RepID=UPI003CEFFEE1
MAVEETTPHGLKKYTAGTDPIPGRTGHNQMIDKINQIPGLGIGPLSSRPAPSAGLRFWVEESTRRLSVNIGTEWAELGSVGAVTPSNVVAAGTASEGTSQRAARADHTHNLPVATKTAAGAMSSTDKTFLDEATAGTTTSDSANRLVKRDSVGSVYFESVRLQGIYRQNGHAVRYETMMEEIATVSPGAWTDLILGTGWTTAISGTGRAQARINNGMIELKGYISIFEAPTNMGTVFTLPSGMSIGQYTKTLAVTASTFAEAPPGGAGSVALGADSAGTKIRNLQTVNKIVHLDGIRFAKR